MAIGFEPVRAELTNSEVVKNKKRQLQRVSEDIQKLRLIQKTEFATNLFYRPAWETAKEYFNKQRNQGFFEDEYPEEYHIALICYADNDFSILRGFHYSPTRSPMHFGHSYWSYYKLWTTAMMHMKDDERYKYTGSKCLYLGEPRRDRKLYPFDSVNFSVAFARCVSASDDLDVARRNSGPSGTIFRIIIVDDDKNREDPDVLPCIDLSKNHNKYEEEAKILIWPFACYKVKGRKMRNNREFVTLKYFSRESQRP